MKNALKSQGFVLLEVIVSIVLFSIISLGTLEFIFSLRQSSVETTDHILETLKLESTRLFLSHNKEFSLLTFSDNRLSYNGDLLLDEISSYQLQIVSNIATIDICIKKDTICQIWKIRL